MSMSAAIGNFMSWSERHQARRESNRLDHEVDADDEEQQDSTVASAEISSDANNEESDPESPPINNEDDEESLVVETIDEGEEGDDADTVEVPLGDQEEEVVPPSDTTDGLRRNTVTLEELEEERELARRRTSACILLSVFILFRLWVEALAEQDFGLLLLCLVGTSWTARFIRHNREREEELDRRIANYVENSGADGTTQVNRADLQLLSFQAQLALAIMESQRVMVQGGHGNPDGHHGRNQGVSDEAKEHWERFTFRTEGLSNTKASKRGYGSLSQEDEKVASEDDLAHCSICLCEYEDGEAVVKLPCSHEYHDECITGWTRNHVRCPLCNFDCESATGDADTITTISTQGHPEDSIV